MSTHVNPDFRVTITPASHTKRNGHDLAFRVNESQSFAKGDLTPNELLETADQCLGFLIRTAHESGRVDDAKADRLKSRLKWMVNALYESVSEDEPCIHPGVFATDEPTTHCHRCGRDVPRREL